jgi:hypothetical protein
MAIANSENVTGSGSGSSISLTSWTPSANDLILVGVALLDETDSVSSINGNGLTFSLVTSATSSNYRMEVWKAQGASPSSGQITVNMTSGGSNVFAIATRFSGVDTITNVEDSASATGSNDNDMLVTGITASGSGSWIVGFGTHGNDVLTVPSGETAILINQSVGGGPNTCSNSEWYEEATGSGDYQIGDTNDLGGNTNWAAIGVALKPSTSRTGNVASGTLNAIQPGVIAGAASRIASVAAAILNALNVTGIEKIISFTNLGNSANPDIADSSDATSYSNSSWTPPTDGLILLFVSTQTATSGAQVAPTVSGNNLTWVQIATRQFDDPGGTDLRRITLFAADASGSTTGQTTIDFGSNTQLNCLASFFQATGVDLSGGVAAAFVQSPTNEGTDGTESSVTLSAAADSRNRPIYGSAQTTSQNQTPRSGWTEADDLTISSPTDGLETQWREDAFETTASATFSEVEDWGCIAAELKALVSAGGTRVANVAVVILNAIQPGVVAGAASRTANVAVGTLNAIQPGVVAGAASRTANVAAGTLNAIQPGIVAGAASRTATPLMLPPEL